MNFSDFSLKSKPAVRYQVDNLRSICEQFQILLEGYRGLAKGLTRIKSPSDGDDISERSSKVWSGKKQDNNLRGEMMKAKRGFTLVEILIVVVILGILAAIVIPQFTGASTEAKESSLVSDLQTIRSQIELYKIQHNDTVPGEILQSDGSITTATDATFVEALCSKTDQYGNVGTDPTVNRFGPYMQKMPINPFSNATGTTLADYSEDGAMVVVGASKLTTGNENSGWYFVVDRDSSGNPQGDHGAFQAADPLSSPVDGTPHVEY
jgi:general secretion pathway protein G